MFLVAAAFLLGGGGVRYGIVNLAVQLIALGVLAANRGAVSTFFRDAPRPLVALVALTILVPVVQLVPLPPQAWSLLPGRDLALEAMTRSGEIGWLPLSLDRGRTLLSLVGLIVPFTVLAVGWSAGRDRIRQFAVLVVAAALAGFLLGTVQVLSDHRIGVPFPENEMKGVLFGLFANRNTTGLFFVVSLILLAALPAAPALGRVWLAKAGTAFLLVVGVFLTQSRAGIGLLLLPAALVAVRFGLARLKGHGRREGTGGGALVGAALLIAMALAATVPLLDGGRIASGLARFDQTETVRPQIWEDAHFAAERYWPVGSGTGTFDEVFQVDESLEYLTGRRAGRAHNDYLELAVESGAVGLLVLAGWAVWVAIALARSRRGRDFWPAAGSATAIAAIAFASAVDYPLRNQAMLCTVALLILILARAGAAGREEPQ